MKETKDYYPFGQRMAGRARVEGRAATEDYTGHERDEGTGLLYAGARYYMPAFGRWTTPDPLADEYPAWSPYNYSLNNPTNLVDPNGLAPLDDYYIYGDGTIEKVETDDSFDRFYRADRNGNVELIAKLEKNEAGLIKFPDSGYGFDRYGTSDAGGYDAEVDERVGSGDHYLQPETAAALFGVTQMLGGKGLTLSFGDMSSSNGSDPWQSGFPHHAGHGHQGARSGLDVDFRYLNKEGRSFQNRAATTDPRFSLENNQAVYDTARRFGFRKNYQGTRGPKITGPVRVGGHNDHGHLGYAPDEQ